MAYDIKYILFSDGQGVAAHCDGRKIGEITFVRAGGNNLIIDYTAVDSEYRNADVGLGLVAHVVDIARAQHKKIVALCPFAMEMFRRHPEFDDVRLVRAQ